MVKRTYTQILEELRRLIVQQSRWRYQVCIEGETEELMNKIAELQEQIDEKTSEIKSYQRRIIASISLTKTTSNKPISRANTKTGQ